MIRRHLRLVRDERGASLIEMALVMPFFAALIVGVVDLSRAYSAKLQLEQAAYRAVEKVQQYQSSDSTVGTLKTEAAAAAGVTETTSNPQITYTLECNGTSQSYTTACTSGAVRWVNVDISKNFVPMFTTRAWPGANSDGSITLHGRAGLRTQ
ncbi:MAG: TadE/TadG family type IV pilus assembly protein [Sphingomicrobium sp.]